MAVYDRLRAVACSVAKRGSGVPELPLFEFGFHLSACNGCGNIVSVPVLRFEEREEEYVGPCPVCQDDVAIITDMEDTVCPVCGNKTLLAEEIGRWD